MVVGDEQVQFNLKRYHFAYLPQCLFSNDVFSTTSNNPKRSHPSKLLTNSHFQLLLVVCLFGLASSQRRIAKPIPLGFNPKPYSPQYSPKPTAESPIQYDANPVPGQQYDPSINAVAYSSPAPFSVSSVAPRNNYQVR